MGYHICTTPGPHWFTARSFIRASINELLSIIQAPPAPSIRALIHLQKIRIDLARGLVFMAGQLPKSGSIHDLLSLAAKVLETSHPTWSGRLAALAQPSFAVSYGGTGQYGVPNYELVRGAERESATAGLGPLFQVAFAERITHGKHLQALALEMLCEIYLAESAYDINYYSFWEAKEITEILEHCLRHGLFADEASALSACDGDLDALSYLPAVRQLGKSLNRESWTENHAQEWWRFSELDSLWHGCSD